MSEAKDAMKKKFRDAVDLGADTSISTKDAVSQVMDGIRKDYAVINAYNEARAQRKKAVAARLHAERKAHNYKQQDVADMTGIHIVTLSGYEIGKSEPPMEALVRLADAYGVTLDYLLCRTDEK